MSDEKKNGGTAIQGQKAVPEWEWETPHGLVKLSVDIVRNYFCPQATVPEIMHFMAVCRYHKANPWLKEAYLIKYDEREAARIVVGKDFYNRRAQDFPAYAGHAAGLILQVKDAAGKFQIERRPGAFHTDQEVLLGGWARVYRKDREEPVEIEVEVGEYIQTRKDGTVTRFWKEKPSTMIRKVALSQAWREAFPAEFAGTIDEAEVVGREPMTIEMPRSVEEAKSQSPVGATGEPGQANVVTSPPASDPAAQENPGPALSPSANARALLWTLLQDKAAAGRTSPTKLLFKLTKHQNMTDLSDAEVQALLVQLG